MLARLAKNRLRRNSESLEREDEAGQHSIAHGFAKVPTMQLRLLWTLRALSQKASAGALAMALGLPSAMAADPPDVASARAVYQQVKHLRQSRRLRLSQQAGADTDAGEARCGCAPYGATTACTLGRDAQGVARAGASAMVATAIR